MTYGLKFTGKTTGRYLGFRSLGDRTGLHDEALARESAIRMSRAMGCVVSVERCNHSHDSNHFTVIASYVNGEAA